MSEIFSERFRGFDEVWKRVQGVGAEKAAPPARPANPGKQTRRCGNCCRPHQRRG